MKRTVSIADTVFEKLEEDILSGTIARGEVLTELKLSEMLNVSRTPIREALAKLEQEGLVEAQGKGAIVLGISKEDLYDIYQVRMRIEGMAAARCAEMISKENLERLRESIELQEFYTERNRPDSIKEIDSEFHSLIFRSCGSVVFESLLSGLHRRVKRYRRVSFADPERAKAAAKEHREIYDAIAAGQAGLAEELTARHIRNAFDSIVKECK